jgi:predicted NBD/HSP70 family sugar kinase
MENGCLTGKSVAEAFNKGDPEQRKVAEEIFYQIGRYLGMGIKALILGEGEKAEVEWSKEDWNYWRKVKQIILGGFIPEAGEEAEVLIKGAKDFLREVGLDYIKIERAPLKGKEAGILGTVAYVVSQGKLPLKEEEGTQIGILAVDFGRTHIGTGIVLIDPISGNLIGDLKDAIVYEDDTEVTVKIDIPKGGTIEDRQRLVGQIVDEIIKAINYAEAHDVPIARDIGICSPGLLDKEGYFIGGTDYLPLWDKKSGFHLPSAIETELHLRGYSGYKIHILNDGNAQALGNVRYGLEVPDEGIIGYIGPGSGLGGGLIEIKN